MYPTLYHVLLDWFGLELQLLKLLNTFGFFVALAFLAAARVLASELDRKTRLGLLRTMRRPNTPPPPPTPLDLFWSSAAAFVIGYKVGGVALGGAALQGSSATQRYLLSTEGHAVAGVATALTWAAFRYYGMRAANTTTAPPVGEPGFTEVTAREHTMGITGAAALGGMVGAKVFHFLERPRSIIEFIRDPSLEALFAGLTVYGGLIVGGLTVYVYCRRHQLEFKHVADAVAPGLMLAYGIGRLGCHFSGDGDWGIPNTSPPPAALAWLPHVFWSYDYPNNVLSIGVPMESGGYPGYGTQLVPPVFPTPLYEALAASAIFALLWAVRTRMEKPLLMFGFYLMGNGVERFWIESIRVNATYDIFGHAVTQAQLISVLMFIGGAALVAFQVRNVSAPPPTEAAPPA